MPKIVILDGYTLNPGDLDWSPLEKLGDLEVYPRTDPSKVEDRAASADIILLNKTKLSSETLSNLPNLKFVSVMATGVNTIDLQKISEMGIIVSNVSDYSTSSVAQHTFALILELTNRVGYHSGKVAEGAWSNSDDWSYWDYPLIELQGKTLGIIGLGNIGQQVAKLGHAFDMRVITSQRSAENQQPDTRIQVVALEEVFSQSDILSLHCPLTESTRHMVDLEMMSLMKPNAFLINTSRGPLIYESDLVAALDRELIAGAAMDVLGKEPPDQNNLLVRHPKCLVTPHQSWATFESRKRLMTETIENIKAFLEGNPRNVVNG